MTHISSISITDPVFKKRRHNAFNRFILKYIKDERDLPFIHLSLLLTIIILPVAGVLYTPGLFSWWIGGVYLVVLFTMLLGPYILMLHNTSHRKLFKKEYNWMNRIIPWFLGPFFGETPETYYAHHICMHHPENNLKDDLSSTMKYQRDSFFGFMHYFGTFFFLGIIALSQYFIRKRRPEWMRNILVGEFSFFALVAVLCLVSWKATLIMFVIPFCFTRFAMMAGNWGQHAFVDPTDPGNSYKNSLTCINARYNKTCFNDGYHIGHHVRPAMHWTDMPVEFQENIDKYREQQSVVFKGIDFFIVWFLLMTKSYGTLANHYIHLDDRLKSKEEVIAFLKSRTKRIPKEAIEKYAGQEYMRDLRKRKL